VRVQEYSLLAEQYLRHLRRAEYAYIAGLSDALPAEPIFDQFSSLFTRAVVLDRLRHRRDREGRYLAEFAVHSYLERNLAPATEAIASAEHACRVECRGDTLTFWEARRQFIGEASRSRRLSLAQALTACIASHNSLRAERLVRQHALARELAFPGYRELCEELCGYSLRALSDETMAFLEDSQATYESLLARRLEAAGIPRHQATNADVQWLVLGPRHEQLMSREALLPAAEKTLAALGVSLAGQRAIHLDLEQRPHKHDRPHCIPVSVPDEIRIVASPRGGCVDFLSFFHELGHAQHAAHTHPRLPCAYRLMGDDAVSEAFAFLFQALVLEEQWLREVIGAQQELSDLLEAGRLLDLWYVRRYAGKLAYELELHAAASDPTALASRYSQLLSKAVAVPVPPEHYLFDLDDAFYSSRYLRGWMLEAALREGLRQRFGPVWFNRVEAGEWLRSLWARGKELDAQELAGEVGSILDTAPLRRRLLGEA